MSAMYPTIERLYKSDDLTLVQLDKAVSKGWITEDEKQNIISV